MSSVRNHLENLYAAFNRQDIEIILEGMAEDVKWANGMEGGFVEGRERVREYWREQFKIIRGELTPLQFETGENRGVVKLRQKVFDLSGNLLDDKTIEHVFTFENGLIKMFEIGDLTKPFTENENFRKLQNRD